MKPLRGSAPDLVTWSPWGLAPVAVKFGISCSTVTFRFKVLDVLSHLGLSLIMATEDNEASKFWEPEDFAIDLTGSSLTEFFEGALESLPLEAVPLREKETVVQSRR